MVFTAILMFYNTEWQYNYGMAVNYCGKKFYNIGPPRWDEADNEKGQETRRKSLRGDPRPAGVGLGRRHHQEDRPRRAGVNVIKLVSFVADDEAK